MESIIIKTRGLDATNTDGSRVRATVQGSDYTLTVPLFGTGPGMDVRQRHEWAAEHVARVALFHGEFRLIETGHSSLGYTYRAERIEEK